MRLEGSLSKVNVFEHPRKASQLKKNKECELEQIDSRKVGKAWEGGVPRAGIWETLD